MVYGKFWGRDFKKTKKMSSYTTLPTTEHWRPCSQSSDTWVTGFTHFVFKKINFLFVCVCMWLHVLRGAYRHQEDAVIDLEPVSRGNHEPWGTELRTSERSANILNCWAISPIPFLLLNFSQGFGSSSCQILFIQTRYYGTNYFSKETFKLSLLSCPKVVWLYHFIFSI